MKTHKIYKLDQFFTTPGIAKKCLGIFCSTFNINTFDVIVEPSAGEGSFFYLLPKNKRVGIEIDPLLCANNKEYIKSSFLTYTLDKKKVCVIGNPPFGTQNSVSVKFFNHAATFSEVISFIVPLTWEKHSIQNRLDENFFLVSSTHLPNNIFYGDKDTNVKCCFQIWEKRNYKRKKINNCIFHKDWEFLSYINTGGDIHPPKKADFCILAYGSKCGRISDNLNYWRPKSVHFIKSNIPVKTLKSRFESLDFSLSNISSRQCSLGKNLLVSLYKEKYE